MMRWMTGLLVALVLVHGPVRAAGAAPEKTAWCNADFDGDGLADPVEFNGSNCEWKVCFSASRYQTTAFRFGASGCSARAADYDGDRKADPAVLTPANSVLTVMLSGAGYAVVSLPVSSASLNPTTTVPVAADFDGDQRADPALYDESAGVWGARLSAAGYAPVALVFGGPDQTPVAGDYDGDGRTDPGVANRTNGLWSVMLSGSGYAVVTLPVSSELPTENIEHPTSNTQCPIKESLQSTVYGLQPLSADFDGDGRIDPAVYQETTGTWIFRLSTCGYAYAGLSGFGGTGLTAAPGDLSGDGLADPAVYLASSAMVSAWFVGGADVPGSFQQTNVLHVGATLGSVARVNDQAVGLLYGKITAGSYYSSCWYQVVSHGGAVLRDEPVYYNTTPFPASAASVLVVDAAAEPHILTGYYSRNIMRLYRSGSGWTNEIVGTRESGESGVLARIDVHGAIHVVTTSMDESNNTAVVHYYSNRSGTWQKENVVLALPLWPAKWWQWDQDLAVDADGHVHVALSFQHHPNDDVTWPGWIYYLSNRGGTWFSELAAQQSHSSWDSFFPRISLAVDAAGQPAIAAWLKYNVLTGSDALSQLIYCSRTAPNAWTRAMLADTADNYFGTDGGHFTGLYPKLALDQNGAAHIIFSDLASSHVSGYESAVVGQIRYARNTSGGWALATLYRQSAAAGESVYDKDLLVSGDGRGLDVVARVRPAGGDYVVHFSSSRQSVFQFQ